MRFCRVPVVAAWFAWASLKLRRGRLPDLGAALRQSATDSFVVSHRIPLDADAVSGDLILTAPDSLQPPATGEVIECIIDLLLVDGDPTIDQAITNLVRTKRLIFRHYRDDVVVDRSGAA